MDGSCLNYCVHTSLVSGQFCSSHCHCAIYKKSILIFDITDIWVFKIPCNFVQIQINLIINDSSINVFNRFIPTTNLYFSKLCLQSVPLEDIQVELLSSDTPKLMKCYFICQHCHFLFIYLFNFYFHVYVSAFLNIAFQLK